MTDKQDPIAHAARLLREAAEELRQSHTLSSDRNNWMGDCVAKAAHDEHFAAAQALEDWEAAVGAGGVQALSAAPAVPVGWKLVPVEPTNDMQKAADEWAAKGFDWPKAVYRAMLAASPTPPAEQQAAPKAAPARRVGTIAHIGNGSTTLTAAIASVLAAPQQEAQKPVAWYEYNADLDAWFLAYRRNPKAKTRPLVFGDTAPQPAPAPLSDDTERLEWLLWKLPGDALRYVVGELSDTSSGAEFRAAIDAALAAHGGK